MKFLCVPCDKPMQLSETRPPDRGSIALVYGCPDCGYEFAMLTNPAETQLVGSLGVKMGPAGGTKTAGESKCPFTGVVRELEATAAAPADGGVRWSDAARARLAQLPEFVQPMVQAGIERFAREGGHDEIDEQVLDAARRSFGV